MNIAEQAAHLEAQCLARVEEQIAKALTPAVLSKLAFKGVTPEQAKAHLRARAYQAMEQALFTMGRAA